jgi:hypothetical protein
MTDFVVNSELDNTQENLNNQDTLLVTNTGSLVDPGFSPAINAASNNIITDNGSVYGAVDIFTAGAGANIDINVNGSLQATNEAIIDQGPNLRVNVGSQGLIQGANIGVFLEGEANPTDSVVTNAGTILGSGLAAVAGGGEGGDSINNSGMMSGFNGINFVENLSANNVENSGTIEGTQSSAIFSETLQAIPLAGINITNTASGLITNNGFNGDAEGVLHFDDGPGSTSSIENQGQIIGIGNVIQSLSDTLNIANSGTIHGGLLADGTVDLDNSGLWTASANSDGLTLGGEGNLITNEGRINAPITFNDGGDVLINSGTISGNIAMGVGDKLTNHTRINGEVTLDANDTLVNFGVINGDLILGGTDTVTNNGGSKVLGTIVESSQDLLGYAGHFGQQTIQGFNGSNGDLLQFAANDFGSFLAVKNHAHQVGADTVIRLDAADSITLEGVAKSSLVKADFKFV